MKKKIVSLTMAAAMTLSCAPALLAGCGSDGISDYEHTIVFYSSQGDALQAKTAIAIANFEAKYPGWKVSHQAQGGYDGVMSKIMSDFEGDLQPDLAYCYPDHVAQYLPTELVLDINTFINSDEKVTGVDPQNKETEVEYSLGYTADELKDFTEIFWKEGQASNFSGYAKYGYTEDSMLALPFVKSTELLYYNKTVLDELHLTPATTWDELWEQAPTIKAAYPKSTVLGYDSEANWFINMCKQNGWGYTDLDEDNHYLFNKNNDDLKTWLTSLKDMYSKSKGWITTQKVYGSYTSTLFTDGPAEGGIVYCVGSSGGASYQTPTNNKFKAEVAPIPGSVQSDGTVNNSVISQGPSLVMFNAGHGVSNADEKAKMTFLFIKELLDPKFQATFSIQSGYNPCRESVYDLEVYQDHLAEDNLVAKASKVAKDERGHFFTSPAFAGSSTAREQVGYVIQYVMKGQRTADVALNAAYKNCGGK